MGHRLGTAMLMLVALTSCGGESTTEAPVAAEPAAEVTAATPEPTVSTGPAEATEAPVGAEPAAEVTAAEPIEFGDRWPEVLAVATTPTGEGRWRFDVTLSSLYDTPERYADAWRVLDADDVELGIRVLAHDHANEQPFTRSHTIEVPAGLTTVWVEGRDQANGWSGQRFEVALSSG